MRKHAARRKGRPLIYPCGLGVGTLLVLLAGCSFIFRPFAHGSGWTAMAARFPAEAEPDGRRFTWQNVQVGAVRYRNCTTAVVAAQGLYLAVPLPGHAPLLIPWTEFRAAHETRVYWRRAMALTVGEPRIATVTVSLALWEAMRPNLSLSASG